MKKLGFFLLAVFFCGTIAAQNADTAIMQLSDSVVEAYDETSTDVRETTLLQKLNPQQLLDLEKKRMEQQRFREMPLPAWSIVLIATAPFLMVVLIVFFTQKRKRERENLRRDIYMKALESGQPLPEKFFETAEKQSSNLKKGAIWLAVGLGMVVFGLLEKDTDLMGIGAIPFFVGAAYLLVHFLEDKKKNLENE